MSVARAQERDIVWSVLPDPRTPEQREWDAEMDRLRDEPNRLERLRLDIIALVQEYRDLRRQRGNVEEEPCIACQAEWFEKHDLAADALMRDYQIKRFDRQRQAEFKRRNRKGEEGGAL